MSDSSDSEVADAFVRSTAIQYQNRVNPIDPMDQPGPSGIVPNRPPENAIDAEREKSTVETPATASENSDRKKMEPERPQIKISRKNVHYDFYPLSPWMSRESIPRKTYFPQIFDNVVYLRQAHEIYLSVIRRLYPEYYNPRQPTPWELFSLAAEEPCRVTGVDFVLCPARMCRLQLYPTRDHPGRTNERFWIFYHPVPEAMDFLILSDVFNQGPKADWQIGDRFRCIIHSNTWRLGTITQIGPLDQRFRESHFQRYEVRWDDSSTLDRLSFWDLEPIDLPPELLNAQGEEVPSQEFLGYGVRRTPESPLNNPDVYGNIFAKFNEVMQGCLCEPFVNAVHERADPTYLRVVAYPIDFHLIMSRFMNGFYRRLEGLQSDIDYLHRNALLFYPRKHDCVRIARFCNSLLTRIIRNCNRKVRTSVMFHDSVLEQAEIELEEVTRERLENRARLNVRNQPSNVEEIQNDEVPQDMRRVLQYLQSDLPRNENRPSNVREIPHFEVPLNPGRYPRLVFHPTPNMEHANSRVRSKMLLSLIPAVIDDYKRKLIAARHSDNPQSSSETVRSDFLRMLETPPRQENAPIQPRANIHQGHPYYPQLVLRSNQNQPPVNQRQNHNFNQPFVEANQNQPPANQHQNNNNFNEPLVEANQNQRPANQHQNNNDFNEPLVEANQNQRPENQHQIQNNFNEPLVEANQNQWRTSECCEHCIHNVPLVVKAYQNLSSMMHPRARIYNPPLVFLTNQNEVSFNQRQMRVRSPPIVIEAVQNQRLASEHQKRDSSPPLDFSIHKNRSSSSENQERVSNSSPVVEIDQNRSSRSENQEGVSNSSSLFEIGQNRPSRGENQEGVSNSPSLFEIDQNLPSTSQSQEGVSNSPSLFEIDQNLPSTSQSQGHVNYSRSLSEIDQNLPSTSQSQGRVPYYSSSLFEIDQNLPSTSQSQGCIRYYSPSLFEFDQNQPSTSLCQERVNSPASVLESDQNQSEECPSNPPLDSAPGSSILDRPPGSPFLDSPPGSPPLDLKTDQNQPPARQCQKRIDNPPSLGMNFNQPSTSQRQNPLNSPPLSLNINHNRLSTNQPLEGLSLTSNRKATSKHHQQPAESNGTAASTSEPNKGKQKKIYRTMIKENEWRFDCMKVVQSLWDDLNDVIYREPAMENYRGEGFEWHNLGTIMDYLNDALFKDPYTVVEAVHNRLVEGRSLNATGDREVTRIIDRLTLNFNRGMDPILNRWWALEKAERKRKKLQEYKRYKKNLPGMPDSPPLSPP